MEGSNFNTKYTNVHSNLGKGGGGGGVLTSKRKTILVQIH